MEIISCDGEFKSLMTDVKDDMNVDMDGSSSSEHESATERNDGTIEE